MSVRDFLFMFAELLEKMKIKQSNALLFQFMEQMHQLNKQLILDVSKDMLQRHACAFFLLLITCQANVKAVRSAPFLADRFNKASCLFCRNSIKCETSSVKHDGPLSEVLLPITIMNLIGNWKIKNSHASHLAPYMVVT